jgi:hypothetical protein
MSEPDPIEIGDHVSFEGWVGKPPGCIDCPDATEDRLVRAKHALVTTLNGETNRYAVCSYYCYQRLLLTARKPDNV